MTTKILTFKRPVNGVFVEQRVTDGFINATAMCVAHSKNIKDWIKTKQTWEFLVARSRSMRIEIKEDYNPDSSVTRISALFPHLLVVKRGSPANGGGTWIHYKLAVNLAQFCNTEFAILVADWVEEWLTTGKNPVDSDLDQQFVDWQERYDIRVYLKDFLRLELMGAVIRWAEDNRVSPISLCSQVHDVMNLRIQGAKAQQIRSLGKLPLSALLRDHLGVPPLASYSAINKLAKNAIQDRGLDPIAAVHEACDHYLGKTYVPKLAKICENVHAQGRSLRAAKKRKQLSNGHQLSLWDSDQAS